MGVLKKTEKILSAKIITSLTYHVCTTKQMNILFKLDKIIRSISVQHYAIVKKYLKLRYWKAKDERYNATDIRSFIVRVKQGYSANSSPTSFLNLNNS